MACDSSKKSRSPASTQQDSMVKKRNPKKDLESSKPDIPTKTRKTRSQEVASTPAASSEAVKNPPQEAGPEATDVTKSTRAHAAHAARVSGTQEAIKVTKESGIKELQVPTGFPRVTLSCISIRACRYEIDCIKIGIGIRA